MGEHTTVEWLCVGVLSPGVRGCGMRNGVDPLPSPLGSLPARHQGDGDGRDEVSPLVGSLPCTLSLG
jgi:hypothetical protein